MHPAETKVVPAGAFGDRAIEEALVKMVRGRRANIGERRFITIVLVSLVIHILFLVVVDKYQLKPVDVAVIEEVPERFAKLIIEKPLKKIPETMVDKKGVIEDKTEPTTTPESKGETSTVPTPVKKVKAKKAVEVQMARVEKKIRTVGVLGMLTGAGATAKGAAVVDVLGKLDKKETMVKLEDALDKITGLQKTKNVNVLDKKLVSSKDASIPHRESIDDLLANVGTTDAIDLVKKGSFIIQKPESIEGLASSNAQRDNNAINAIVASHKISIRMSFERYLQRNPSLSGKITIRFTISSSGSVKKVVVVENTTGNTELENEIVRKIRMWKFEPITEGDVTVTYPFVFMNSG